MTKASDILEELEEFLIHRRHPGLKSTKGAPPMPVPTGTVSLFNNGTLIADASVATLDASGNYTISYANLPAGANNITAVYSGDSNFDPSTSPVDVQTVNSGLSQSSTSLSSTPNPSNVGDSVAFSGAVAAA